MRRISLGRSVLAAGILSLAMVPIAAGAAYADTTIHHHTAKTKLTVTTLHTRVAHAKIRSLANNTKHSTVRATLPRSGSNVKVTCYVIGASVNGDKTWYRTTSPTHGYIAGHLLAIATEPATGVAMCGK